MTRVDNIGMVYEIVYCEESQYGLVEGYLYVQFKLPYLKFISYAVKKTVSKVSTLGKIGKTDLVPKSVLQRVGYESI